MALPKPTVPAKAGPLPARTIAPPLPIKAVPKPVHSSDVNLEQIKDMIIHQRWEESLVALGRMSDINSGSVAVLLEAWVRIQIKDFEQASKMAAQILEQDAWSKDATVLLGFIAKWRNEPENAIEWFKRAVYSHNDCWVAHYYLGDLYRQLGNLDKAQRSYRVVLQLLSGDHHPDGGLKIPLGLPVGEIRFLCERHSVKATQAGR